MQYERIEDLSGDRKEDQYYMNLIGICVQMLLDISHAVATVSLVKF